MAKNLFARGLVAGLGTAFLFFSHTVGAEEVLRAVSAFPKTNQLTQSFLRFIDKTNKAGKGLVQIKFIGGPEVTKPRQQPNAMRNGLFDMMYGPAGYYSGLFPEADFLMSPTNPVKARASGAYTMIRQAMREKMGARMMGWFDYGVSLHLFFVNEPKRTASGGIDLTGLKLRSSPTYRDFIKDLGGTPVIMRGGQVYTALERGTVVGMGFSLPDIRDRKVDRFVKYRVDPPRTSAGILMNINQKKWDGLSQPARDLLNKLSAEWEIESENYWNKQTEREKAALAKGGMETITLTGASADEFVTLFRKGPWRRMENNPKIKIDLKKLKRLLN